jgi:peptidoglycan/LPS O-acetylase OafA/YrhL
MRSVGPTRLVGLASVGIIVLYGLATSVDPLGRLLNLSPQFVALFVMGMGAGHLVNKDVPARTGRRLLIAGSVLALLFIGLCVLLDLRVVEQQYFWIAFVAGGATACLVASLLLGQARWLNKLLASDVMRSTGMYSYSIYCVHLPILWLTWHFLVAKLATGTTERFAALMALGVPLALLGSYVFSRVFEKPFLSHRSFRSLRELTPWRVRPSEGQQGETSPVRAATSSAARP